MIISRTPFRISFFGGGTDYPAWYLKEGGAVLSTTIDKYCYISCRVLPPFFNIKHRIVWSHIETVSTTAEILHPAVREGLRYLGFDDTVGLEIHHQGDLPARTGIGSSASFVVGLMKVLSAMKGKYLRKRDLALKAMELEQQILKENVGSQDQVATTYGGFNAIYFLKNGDFQVVPVKISMERLLELESCLMLIYTGTSRLASEVAADVVANLSKKRMVLKKMRSAVDTALNVLRSDIPLDDFGFLLHENWMLKRELSNSVSNDNIDGIYKIAIENGALGGKLLGAGSSGFMVFFVPFNKRQKVKSALCQYCEVPFKFESRGSVLVDLEQWSEGRE